MEAHTSPLVQNDQFRILGLWIVTQWFQCSFHQLCHIFNVLFPEQPCHMTCLTSCAGCNKMAADMTWPSHPTTHHTMPGCHPLTHSTTMHGGLHVCMRDDVVRQACSGVFPLLMHTCHLHRDEEWGWGKWSACHCEVTLQHCHYYNQRYSREGWAWQDRTQQVHWHSGYPQFIMGTI